MPHNHKHLIVTVASPPIRERVNHMELHLVYSNDLYFEFNGMLLPLKNKPIEGFAILSYLQIKFYF